MQEDQPLADKLGEMSFMAADASRWRWSFRPAGNRQGSEIGSKRNPSRDETKVRAGAAHHSRPIRESVGREGAVRNLTISKAMCFDRPGALEAGYECETALSSDTTRPRFFFNAI
jgi:hypothetical protein